jgi:hypothetical protein
MKRQAMARERCRYNENGRRCGALTYGITGECWNHWLLTLAKREDKKVYPKSPSFYRHLMEMEWDG